MITPVSQLVADAEAQIEKLDVEQAIALPADSDYLFVDLRDIRELQSVGRIPGALHCPRGLLEFWLDPQSPYHKPELNSGKKLLFYCAVGWRSALATKTAQDMGAQKVAHLAGGFQAWQAADGPIEPNPSRNAPPSQQGIRET